MLYTESSELKEFSSEYRLWQGIPSIAVTPKGRIFITFYSGSTGEFIGNFALLLKSDDGVDFGEPIAVAYEEGYRCYDPQIWLDPLGRLWFIWARAPKHAVYASICEHPDADTLEWSEPFRIGEDVMMNKPTVLSSGEWLFPIAVWDLPHLAPVMVSDTKEKGSFVYRTSDNGATFERLGASRVQNRSFDEHMVLELKDGRLLMLVRTNYGIGASYSSDGGITWSEGEDSGLGGPCSRFFITRLRSGRVLLINHYGYNRRDHLTALLSDDDGKNFKWKLLLDERSGVSYPDAQEADDGYIYITYDRNRGAFLKSLDAVYRADREVLYARITEEDIMAGELVSPESRLKVIASKLGRYANEQNDPYKAITAYSPAAAAEKLALNYRKDQVVAELFDAYPTECSNMHERDNARLDALIARLDRCKSTNIKLLGEIIEIIRKAEPDGEKSTLAVEIKAEIDKDFTENTSVSEIASRLGISMYYMMHIFKKAEKTTVVDYRNRLRIERAKRLLNDTDEKIVDIAYECGFASASYFSKLFKASVGISPSEFRKSR